MTRIKLSFARRLACLGWADVAFAWSNQWITAREVVSFARDRVGEGSPSVALVRLSTLDESDGAWVIDDSVGASLAALVGSLPAAERQVEVGKWDFLRVAWLHAHRAEYGDPLGELEDLYAELGYPERLSPLIRYMPSDEPRPTTKEAGETRLLARWRLYLETEARRWGQERELGRGAGGELGS
jgi:hypothetical protein